MVVCFISFFFTSVVKARWRVQFLLQFNSVLVYLEKPSTILYVYVRLNDPQKHSDHVNVRNNDDDDDDNNNNNIKNIYYFRRFHFKSPYRTWHA